MGNLGTITYLYISVCFYCLYLLLCCLLSYVCAMKFVLSIILIIMHNDHNDAINSMKTNISVV